MSCFIVHNSDRTRFLPEIAKLCLFNQVILYTLLESNAVNSASSSFKALNITRVVQDKLTCLCYKSIIISCCNNCELHSLPVPLVQFYVLGLRVQCSPPLCCILVLGNSVNKTTISGQCTTICSPSLHAARSLLFWCNATAMWCNKL